ncbi:amino acid transporter [Pholiota conissans]|uniref:Amino acid transporter n=1 Tax=Pholiota conissans TaxID=109636 RepID=A0A9P5Z4J9_9AGAR|nr:amino acid transporter [Pholiota conissans]
MSAMELEKGGVTQTKDEELLASLGYKQEFRREFAWYELLGLAFSIIGIVQSVASVLVYSIPNGGPAAMVWGWFTCCIFLMSIALAIAELASAAPTSGGLYYWSFNFSSKRYRRILCWLVGYSNSIAYIAAFASADYATSLQIFAAVTIGSNGTFIPTTGQIYGLFCGLVVFHAILSSAATKFIARIQIFYMALNILIFVALLIALPVATPPEFKNSASFVFGNFQNLTLWPSGFAFLLSFLAPAWVIGGIDSSVHISEEVKNANVAVPRSIIVSTGLGCVLGWGFIVSVAFNMGTDLISILSNPIGQPMATILFNSLGLKGTLAVFSLIIVTINMASMNVLVATSRQIFAFSRDGALPLSKYLYRINSYTGTPVIAVMFSATGAMLLGLLSFAGPAAIGAIFTMGVVCTYIAYSIPIAVRHIGGQNFTPGPFSLGIFSPLVAFVALGYMTVMIVILIFPTEPAPTAENMNYTVVVVGGILVLSTIYYFLPGIGGRHWFTGPVRTVVDPVPSIKDGADSLSEKDSQQN